MEDVALVFQLRKSYGAPSILPSSVLVSARRWKKLGYVKTTLLNWTIIVRWLMGADADELGRTYYKAPAQ